jgi:NADP-dependent aldehyde dehydrogenase
MTMNSHSTQPVLVAGQWRAADASGTFHAVNPATKEPLPAAFPVSKWSDCDAALAAATAAFHELRTWPGERFAAFLERYAARLEARKGEIVALANQETALPLSPRLADVEFPRTTNQLLQAAAAARDGSWRMPTIDTKQNIRSQLAAIGSVLVFGPNNFPLAFGSASGGDFAAAVAAGNPVIAKANTSHPGTTKLFAEEAHAAAQDTNMPAGFVQLIYRTSHADGEHLVSDHRTGATGYTGSRSAGLKLKAAADAAGKPIYLELSSVNPVVVLPGAIEERLHAIVGEFATSALMGTGQFCTNPGLTILLKGPKADAFVSAVAEKYKAAPVGTLLSEGVEKSLVSSIQSLRHVGATCAVGGGAGGGKGFSHANTLLVAAGEDFLGHRREMQTEAFGNASLVVIADDEEQAGDILDSLEGNLTGCIYSDTRGGDDAVYNRLAPRLREKVGRLLNDKMPTGVAVSAAMNHGGPFPATGHPGFTAVGIPASLRRFAALHCYDNVRQPRLPAELRNKNPDGKLWRLIDGKWTQDDVA